MERDETYNGWANWETWCLMVNIDADTLASLLPYGCDLVDAEDYLKEWYTEYREELAENGRLTGDLLNIAPQRVNWKEVAEAALEARGEEEEEDDESEEE